MLAIATTVGIAASSALLNAQQTQFEISEMGVGFILALGGKLPQRFAFCPPG